MSLYTRILGLFRPAPFFIALLFYSIISLIIFHVPLLHYITDHKGGFGIIFSLSIAYICTTNMVLVALSCLGLKFLRISLAFLTLCNGIALYFIKTYRVFLTKSMMGNVLHTNFYETRDLLGLHLGFFMLLGLVLGSLFFFIPSRIQHLKINLLFF
ncbi:phosphoethanolamine transferase domain-containing protein [Helicobacter suis]|uniref:phosphoethanolamine transferase domain-containing protein n=1 Tax=Helicobacter suis TaxID=104628 RepID=UPI0013D0829A|nr:phosphoethanolamine transferase domain-containing protein [Helicobacter suis]